MTVVRWVCDNPACGRLAVEVRTPATVEPVKYAPTRCVYCKGTTFTRREDTAA